MVNGHETTMATTALLSVGLMMYQARKIVSRFPSFVLMVEMMGKIPADSIIEMFGLTQISVMQFSNLVYWMQTNHNEASGDPPTFASLDLSQYEVCRETSASILMTESLFLFLKVIGCSCFEISALHLDFGINKDVDLLKFVLDNKDPVIGNGPSDFITEDTRYRLRWAMDNALLQHHSPAWDTPLSDVPIQQRDLCGDFDFEEATRNAAYSLLSKLSIKKHQAKSILTLRTLRNFEAKDPYDRLLQVAILYPQFVGVTNEPSDDEDDNAEGSGSIVRRRILQPRFEAEVKQTDPRLQIIQDALSRSQQESIYKCVLYMETQMSKIKPPSYRLACFKYDRYQEWESTVEWSKDKTYFPYKMKVLVGIGGSSPCQRRYVNGRVTFLDGSTEEIEASFQFRT